MKKILNWVLAAILVCGASVFTSCSSDNDDRSAEGRSQGENPAQEQANKNRQEFIQHTRNVMKDLAENLNFSTWNSVNYFNTYLNQYVLLNDDFDKTLSRTFGMEIQKSLKPIPAEIAEMYPSAKYLADVNIANFNYTFTATATGFDVTPNEDEGLVMVLTSPYDPTMSVKIGIKGSGDEYQQISNAFTNENVVVVFNYSKHYDFTLSTMQNGAWTPGIVADADLTIVNGANKPENAIAGATNIFDDAWNLEGHVKTSIPGDATELEFNIGQDPHYAQERPDIRLCTQRPEAGAPPCRGYQHERPDRPLVPDELEQHPKRHRCRTAG